MTVTERIDVAYGRGSVRIEADPRLAEWRVIRPRHRKALADARGEFARACARPTGAKPLKEIVGGTGRVVIVTSDGTRPVPNRVLIPWLLEEMGVGVEGVTVLLGNGTHRANSAREIEGMFGRETAGRVRIVNHDAFDEKGNVCVGRTRGGPAVGLDREYVEADRRIVVGFVEPHFFAGFSGGAKGVVPGVADMETILRVHRAELIADPNSTWGVMDGNPIQREIAEMVGMCPPEFLVNVTLNGRREITGIYAGDYREAHREAWKREKESSMVGVEGEFPIVVTSNSGYPLDQNLYQTVKGMSAAARIVKEGGTILVASECSDGIPAGGNFAQLMGMGETPQDVLDHIYGLEHPVLDQWQAQVLASILRKAEVGIYSTLEAKTVEGCKLEPVSNLQSAIEERIRRAGQGAGVAVLPEGPLTIPYVAGR